MERAVGFVVGMHRSGTSMVTGVLERLGARLPNDLLPAADDNPRGFFEARDVNDAHDRVLAALGRSWFDVGPLPAGWRRSPAVPAEVGALRRVVDEAPGHGLLVVKDPRLCRLLPLWTEEVLEPGELAGALVVVRPEAEVTASIVHREAMSTDAAVLMHARHLAELLAIPPTVPMAVVGDGAVLADWRTALLPALEHLGWDRYLAEAGDDVDGALAPATRRAGEGRAPVPPTTGIGDLIRPALTQALVDLMAAAPRFEPSALEPLAAALTDVDAAFAATMERRQHLWDARIDREVRLELRTAEAALEVEHLRDVLEVTSSDRDRLAEELETTRAARSLRFATAVRSATAWRPWG